MRGTKFQSFKFTVQRRTNKMVSYAVAIASLLFAISPIANAGDATLVTQVTLKYAYPPANIHRLIQPRSIDDSDTLLVAFSYNSAPELMEVGLYSFSEKTLKCISCGLMSDGVPHGSLERPIPIEGNRIVVQTQTGGKKIGNEALFAFQILECIPSLVNCQQAALKPINGVKQKGDLTVRFHLPSPDGKKLVWEALRPTGGVVRLSSVIMMMGDLKRQNNGEYKVINPMVINPPFPNGKVDSPEALAIRGTYFEAKDFCNGGKTLFFNSTYYRTSDVDNFIMDLETGKVERVTTSPGWDEGGSCSPNNKMLVQAVQRGDRDAAALSVITRPPFLESIQAFGNMKNYYVVGEDGTAWPRKGGKRSVVLFPITGESKEGEDDNGVLLSRGEAENWYVGPGEPVFFKDNKRMSWTETKAMTKNTRIVLATITSPLSDTPNPQYVSLPTPSWAIPLSKYPNAVSHPVHIIKDSQGGTATITEEFGLRKQPVTKITYKNFQWKDSILDGTEEATLIKSDSQEGGLPYFTNMKTDVVSTGKRKGHMYMNATVYEGCAENVQRFSCEVNGKPYFTAWPELGSDCSSDHK